MQKLDIALLGINAIRTGDGTISIHTTDIIRTDKTLEAEASMLKAAQTYSIFLETDVKAYPFQWYNFHSVWA